MKLQILKTILFLFLLLICDLSFSLDPRLKYQKISSDHFDVIYNAKSYELAKIYLNEAERAHLLLTPIFGVSPSKTVILLDDTLDLSNGSATPLPRPTIHGILSLPTRLSTIDHFSFWPRDLILHEYAHILNMEPTKGLMKPFRYLLGGFVRPNAFLPRWYLEGLAVEMESRFNENGRLKSTDYDALIRSLSIESLWGQETLSSINETSTPLWPEGQRPYFYGALLWHHLIEENGISIVQKLNDRYAARFPWFITAPIEEETQKDYPTHLYETYQKYGELSQNQIQQIKKEKVTRGKTLSRSDALFDSSPSLSPDGSKLAYISRNLNGDTQILIRQKKSKNWSHSNELKVINPDEMSSQDLQSYETTRVSWSPKGDKIIFDAIGIYDHKNYFYDLYTFDLKTQKSQQITKGLRAREPAFSPDGKKIIFVQAENGNTRISSLDLGEGKLHTLYIPPAGIRVSKPSFLTPNEILFSQKSASGSDQIFIYNLEKEALVRSLDAFKSAKSPTLTPAGIVFTSNDTGVENLYLTKRDLQTTYPLTNSLTRVLDGTIDTSSRIIFYSELTGQGPRIKIAPHSSIKSLPKISSRIANDFPKEIEDKTPELVPPQESYWPIRYMFPQYWIPMVNFIDGGLLATLSLPGSDALGFHQYLIEGSYDSRPKKLSLLGTYLWSNSLGDTTFQGGNLITYYAGSQFTTKTQISSLMHGFYIPGTSTNKWSLLTGYEHSRLESLTKSSSDFHIFSGPKVGINYADLSQKNLDIAPKGQSAKVTYTYYLKNKMKTQYDKVDGSLLYNHSKWLPDHHVLSLRLKGSYSEPHGRGIYLGTSTNSIEYFYSAGSDIFKVRGYPTGEFVGYTLLNGSLEYHFPISNLYSGSNNTTPIYYKRIYASIFSDVLTLNGAFIDKNNALKRISLGKYFMSSGFDINLDTTLFYGMPTIFKLTFAYGFNKDAQGSFGSYLTLLAPSLF